MLMKASDRFCVCRLPEANLRPAKMLLRVLSPLPQPCLRTRELET